MQQRREKEMVRGEAEAVVACSDKSMKIGATMWDLETGEKLLHIPTCASPPFGFLCLRNRFLVASQINKHGSIGDGAILVWPFNKPQQPLLNYTVEAVGPLCCTNDGIYLVGGALSGIAYLWNVTNGKLLKTWRAHNKSLNCMAFSDDDSFLISSSVDGTICVWSMISLLDIEETTSSPPSLHCLSGHTSSITGLLTIPNSILVSSSLDGTCKVWDFIYGRLVQTQVYLFAITSITLHQRERLLFCGMENGTIIVNKLDIGLKEGPSMGTVAQPLELKGQNGAISALTCSRACLISASEDCTIYIWDIFNWEVIHRFNLQKGKVTNLVIVSRSALVSASKYETVSNKYYVSPLDKYPQLINSFKGTTTLLSLCPLHKGNQTCIDLRSSDLSRQKISSSQKADVPMSMTIQMKVETSIKNHVLATNMAEHVTVINKQLQSQLLNFIQHRLLCPNIINTHKTRRKKLKIQSLVREEKNLKP
ncbi:protein ROOT INITIATION DEFECTIVE 3 isoform X2 [Cajanus cajan]|uniref:protein ROOT INITIATION DEFECTIVE 3 isoform X2 n=1 Tax=Cajanus cajan TaxID=3821 RepID=UPI00098DBB41|nr:protein ROOT INITIATION DEFECTIVE 3 isoform X2 [Cajanus cajan]